MQILRFHTLLAALVLFPSLSLLASTDIDSLCNVIPLLVGEDKQQAIDQLYDVLAKGHSFHACIHVYLVIACMAIVGILLILQIVLYLKRKKITAESVASTMPLVPTPSPAPAIALDGCKVAESESGNIDLEQPKEQLYSLHQQLFARIRDVMTQKKLYLDKDLNRQDIASLLNTNPTYIANSIKECSGGLTVSDFVNRYRLRYAAERLLAEPDKPVQEIIDESGFASRATFSRQFRDMYGMSPSDYRKYGNQ